MSPYALILHNLAVALERECRAVPADQQSRARVECVAEFAIDDTMATMTLTLQMAPIVTVAL